MTAFWPGARNARAASKISSSAPAPGITESGSSPVFGGDGFPERNVAGGGVFVQFRTAPPDDVCGPVGWDG